MQEIALGVIEDIEQYGHFQESRVEGTTDIGRPGCFTWNDAPVWEGQCCVVINPTFDHLGWGEDGDFRKVFLAASGVVGVVPVPYINDALSTDEVLDILWAIALG